MISTNLIVCSWYREFYAPKYVWGRRWHGLVWKPISVQEMHRFIGILLRISLSPIDAGGYPAYFTEEDERIQYRSDPPVCRSIHGTRGFVAQLPDRFRMSLNRFKQIRGAFHPEDKKLANGSEDKCYMLRHAINELNKASLANYVAEANLAFDEGGVSCRSRRCPIRQYNKDKPDKYRVDFFILAGSKSRVIHHIDVYQGKNANNVGISEEFKTLPTTMKAVLNAVVRSQISEGSDDVNGYRVVSMDNRYACPQLAYLLWHR